MTKQNSASTTTTTTIIIVVVYLIGIATAQSPNRSDGFPNTNFKPSMSITIIVLIAAFVFMGFFSIYIRQCTRDSRLGAGAQTAAAGARSRRAPRGLDAAVIAAFPTFVYSDVKGLKIGKGALECAVCLNEFEDDETLRLLPKCDHVFHPECIDAWLASHVTCPVCRANLAPKSGDDEESTAHEESISEADPDHDRDRDHEEMMSRSAEIDQVSIDVRDGDQIGQQSNEEVAAMPSRPYRSKSTTQGPRFPQKFPRSHTTGHSIVAPGEDRERFTLRLPNDIRKQILDGKLNRTTSLVTFTTRQASSRRGYRTGAAGVGGGEGSSRGRSYLFGMFDRTARPDAGGGGNVFSRTRSFFRRTPSVTLGKRVDGGSGNGAVKSPFDCIGPKAEGDGDGDGVAPSSTARPPV
ncbi:hypothetical protein Scep_018488 [Stephania cephalantha]|uniref:RING-type E3 ubiquitin transferase n=1 Tax=Stephania cephalantha TaxID=152367 RepID=A0AAP0I952_9MAGN